jgi:hypothetical protein
VKIPKRVNTAWDWAEENGRTIVIITVLVVSGVSALWLPALGAFIFGAAVGGGVVALGLARKIARLRAVNDDLLRENGALRHQKVRAEKKAEVTTGEIISDSLVTQRLPYIAEEDQAA